MKASKVSNVLLSDSIVSAIESINQLKTAKKSWDKQISDWCSKYLGDNSKKILFEIDFSEEVKGYFFPDFYLTRVGHFSVYQDHNVPIQFKKLTCYVMASLGDNSHVGKIEPEYSIHLEMLVDNLGEADEYYATSMNLNCELNWMVPNWITDDEEEKYCLGFLSPFLGRLGVGIVFNNDKERENIITILEKYLDELNKKFNTSFKLPFQEKEKIREVRSKMVRTLTQA